MTEDGEGRTKFIEIQNLQLKKYLRNRLLLLEDYAALLKCSKTMYDESILNSLVPEFYVNS